MTYSELYKQIQLKINSPELKDLLLKWFSVNEGSGVAAEESIQQLKEKFNVK